MSHRVILDPQAPVFLAPRRHRREIPERLDAAGTVLTALDEAAVVKAANELVQEGVRGARDLLPVLVPQSGA